jgi:hypothetical protein
LLQIRVACRFRYLCGSQKNLVALLDDVSAEDEQTRVEGDLVG